MRVMRALVMIGVAAALAGVMSLQAQQAPAKAGADKTATQAAKPQQTVTDRSQMLRGTDTNVKGQAPPSPPQTADKPEPAPPQKGGEKPRGGQQLGLCKVNFDNWTGWFVQVYVDGTYRGMIEPWGDVDTYPLTGTTRLYARVVFTDGSVIGWGPRDFYCADATPYVWKLEK